MRRLPHTFPHALQAFHAVAEERSFRRAAERLGITQPALSRTVKQLEAVTQIHLIERTTRRVQLSEPGKAFYTQTKDVLDRLDRAIEVAQRIQKGVAGQLRVGFNDFAISGLLPLVVRAFRSTHPEVEVLLVDGNTPAMSDNVVDGDLHVAFLQGPALHPDQASLVLREERLVCVLPATHALAELDEIPVAALARERFILGNWGSWRVFNRVVGEFCRAHGVVPHVYQEAEHGDGIVGLVAAAMGVTIYVDGEWMRSLKTVCVRPFREPPPRLQTVAVWRRELREQWATLDQFIATIDEVVATEGVMLPPLRT